jgi:hypothetical protein
VCSGIFFAFLENVHFVYNAQTNCVLSTNTTSRKTDFIGIIRHFDHFAANKQPKTRHFLPSAPEFSPPSLSAVSDSGA